MPNLKLFSQENIDDNADLAVLINGYSHSERTKYCLRRSAPSLILTLNGFTFLLKKKLNQRRIYGEYCLDVPQPMISLGYELLLLIMHSVEILP